MDCYVFAHFNGQFHYPDTTTKVSMKTGHKLYVTTTYETIYSISKESKNGKPDCYQHGMNRSHDGCFMKVKLLFAINSCSNALRSREAAEGYLASIATKIVKIASKLGPFLLDFRTLFRIFFEYTSVLRGNKLGQQI